MARSWLGNWLGEWLRNWLGGEGEAPPPGLVIPGLPAGGQRGKKGGRYGFVQYPEKKPVKEKALEPIALEMQILQAAPSFSASLECYQVPVVEGYVDPVITAKIRIRQARPAGLFAMVQQRIHAAVSVEQGGAGFSASVMQVTRQKTPKWIDDIINRDRNERDDEEALLGSLFGRKL